MSKGLSGAVSAPVGYEASPRSKKYVSKMTHGFFITFNSMILYFKHIIHIDDFPLNGHPPSIYTTIGELSSKFGRFSSWTGRNSTAIMASIFMRLHVAIRDLCATAFCVLLSFVFLRKNNNVAFRHRRHVCAARLMDLRNR